MQESEAAADFSRFLAHLEAGDQVELEREGTSYLQWAFTLMVRSRRPEPSRLDDIERLQREYLSANDPVKLDPEVVDILRQASADFRSQPLDLRSAE